MINKSFLLLITLFVPFYNYANCQSEDCMCAQLNTSCVCPSPNVSCACELQSGKCECPQQGPCACSSSSGGCHCHQKLETVETSIPYPCNCYEETCLTTRCTRPLPQHQFYIGSEIYHVDRKRHVLNDRTPSKQHGYVYGVRAGYDRIKRCRLYWGGDVLYATGRLRGHKNEDKLKSRFTDENIEGRLGYTFQMKSWWLPTFVPYIGIGYYRETNKLQEPSPVIFKLRVSFEYFTAGFLSQIYPSPHWVLGVNFKTRVLFNSRARISDDPNPTHESATICIDNKVQYRVELPIIYRLTPGCDKFAISIVPFYENRHYGYHPDLTYDFHDTKQNFYGFDARLMYLF